MEILLCCDKEQGFWLFINVHVLYRMAIGFLCGAGYVVCGGGLDNVVRRGMVNMGEGIWEDG